MITIMHGVITLKNNYFMGMLRLETIISYSWVIMQIKVSVW